MPLTAFFETMHNKKWPRNLSSLHIQLALTRAKLFESVLGETGIYLYFIFKSLNIKVLVVHINSVQVPNTKV